MDPQVTWNTMLQAAANREWLLAQEHADALLNWLHKRGYPPITSPLEGLPRTWHETVAYFTCRLVQTWSIRQRRQKRQEG